MFTLPELTFPETLSAGLYYREPGGEIQYYHSITSYKTHALKIPQMKTPILTSKCSSKVSINHKTYGMEKIGFVRRPEQPPGANRFNTIFKPLEVDLIDLWF